MIRLFWNCLARLQATTKPYIYNIYIVHYTIWSSNNHIKFITRLNKQAKKSPLISRCLLSALFGNRPRKTHLHPYVFQSDSTTCANLPRQIFQNLKQHLQLSWLDTRRNLKFRYLFLYATKRSNRCFGFERRCPDQ